MHETPRPEDTESRTDDKWAPLLGFLTLILLFATLSSRFLHQRFAFGIFLVLGIASLTTFVILRRQVVSRFFVSRQVRYGANVGVTVLLVTGIAVIVNVIVAQRFDKSADWTGIRYIPCRIRRRKFCVDWIGGSCDRFFQYESCR